MTVPAILADKGNTVIAGKPGDTLQQISSILAENRIGAIIIKETDGKVCGIASERDVVRQVAALGENALKATIDSCMTRKVISCNPGNTIDEVMAIMTKNKFRHLPVMDGGRLLGIISIGDVVKRKIEQAEREAEELKHYIAG